MRQALSEPDKLARHTRSKLTDGSGIGATRTGALHLGSRSYSPISVKSKEIFSAGLSHLGYARLMVISYFGTQFLDRVTQRRLPCGAT
jgi:hypothetical protein